MHTSVEKDPPAAILSHAEETPLLCRRPVRIGLYLFLGLFFLTMLAWRFVPHWLDPDFRKHIDSHRVMVGMSREQVLEAWGSPNTMNVTHTSDGLRREEWIFEDWESRRQSSAPLFVLRRGHDDRRTLCRVRPAQS